MLPGPVVHLHGGGVVGPPLLSPLAAVVVGLQGLLLPLSLHGLLLLLPLHGVGDGVVGPLLISPLFPASLLFPPPLFSPGLSISCRI